MTTDFTNISKSGAQQLRLRQLPPVISEKQQQTKTDNIVRLNSVKRQNIAKLTEENSVEESKLPAKDIPEQEVNQSVMNLNTSDQLISRNLEFHIDKDSGRTVITVRDSKSKEVIRQIPSDQLLEISNRLKELQESNLESNQAAGILFTSKT